MKTHHEMKAVTPEECPKCGCQMFDPFTGKRQIHFIDACGSETCRTPTRRHKCETCRFLAVSPSLFPCMECCIIIMNRKAGKKNSYWQKHDWQKNDQGQPRGPTI